MVTRTGQAGPAATASGVLDPGMPFIRLGTGPELLFLPGMSANHELPTGTDLAFQMRTFRPLAETREVWWVNRRRGLPPTVTIADLAGDYAQVIREHLHPPVDVVAISTGATIALRLAVDHPELVRRLVVAGAFRLSETGRRCQVEFLDHLRAGRPRRAAARIFRTMGGGRLSRSLLLLLGLLTGERMYGGDVTDLIATAEAELGEDLEAELGGIAAPTLVIGGARDLFYSPALFRATATGVARGALLMFRGRGHMGTESTPRFYQAALAFLDGRPLGEATGRRR